ncbi:kinase-like domain-containing protein [Russula vinacea]|nr:kinase-like domain-containing protein [Russula vinacea]
MDIRTNKSSAVVGLPDVLMATLSNDTITETPRPGTTFKNGRFQLWERELLESSEVRRKSTVAQLCTYFLDYYFQLLGYISARKEQFKSYCGRERVLLRRRRAKLRVDQFHIIAQVGQGGYGEVYLARKQETGEVCALKKMRKRTLFKMDEVRHVLVERDILTATKTPWLVRLLYAFQDAEHVYLAMEYVPGGDFRTLLNNSGVLKEEHARFYISEMFAAVGELHKLGYIHRDLKPENFLVDSTGHVKLTDFGLATGVLNPKRIESLKIKVPGQSKDNQIVHRSTMERRSLYRSIRNEDLRYADSIVGSPDYMAPEVLRGKPYSYAVDYWSLGCILFDGGTPEETWTNLKNWTKVLRRPELIAHTSARYCTLDAVRVHPFFKPVPWDNLRGARRRLHGILDDFTSPEDMAKYAEVREKQRNVDRLREKDEPFTRGVWVGFTALNAKSDGGDDQGTLTTIF